MLCMLCCFIKQEEYTPFGINSMRSQMLFQAAQVCCCVYMHFVAPASNQNCLVFGTHQAEHLMPSKQV